MTKQTTKPVKFTFKLQHKETGLAAVGNSLQSCDIKLNKLHVGTIHAPNWMSKTHEYSISFAVKYVDDKNEHNTWKWVRLSKKTQSLEEMKDWVNQMASQIVEKYELHSFTD